MKDHKPCPFCGGKEVETYGYIVEQTKNETIRKYCVECYECDATGPSTYTEEEAWAFWDRR